MSHGHVLILNSDAQPISFQPLSAIGWRDAITAVFLDNVAVVHEYENWFVTSPSRRMAVPSVIMARSYIKFRRMVSFSADNVFLRDEYMCQYCSQQFSPRDLTLDHVKPRSKGGKLSLTNAVAACEPCNRRRGNDESIRPKNAPYHPTYYDLLNKRRRFGITIPHASWMPYIGFDEDRVDIVPPVSMPGFDLPREIEKIRDAVIHDFDEDFGIVDENIAEKAA
jgi:5-methylcytosine-specific restriction endonuclease McrA